MAAPRIIRTREELTALREALNVTHERARGVIAGLVADRNLLERMKFEPLGCDPLDPADPQNLAEHIDQQATYEAAVDALEYLWTKHPKCEWVFAPGAHGSGHDIESSDGLVAAEVFAAVRPSNNRKLTKDIEKVGKFAGTNRYVCYRSPDHQRSERRIGKVVVVSLGARVRHASNAERSPPMAKSWTEVWKLIQDLASLNDTGSAYESFRESVIFELLENGYSRERAAQVVDELVAVARRVPKT